MVPEEKPDFPPLLAAGIHAHTLSELEAVALAPFGGPGLERRIELFSRLKYWIGQLSTVGLSIDVWIDGSFMTHCPMPRDIDLLVVAPENDVNNLPHDVRPTLEQLTNNQFCKRAYNLDVYFALAHDLHQKAYWRGLFGFCRDEITPKGIALIKITP